MSFQIYNGGGYMVVANATGTVFSSFTNNVMYWIKINWSSAGVSVYKGTSAAGITSVYSSAGIPPTTATNGDPSISGVGRNYTYYRFRVRPDGSINLSNLGLPNTVTNYYLTLYNEHFQPSGNTPPANFATIQIEPATGDATLYRP